MYDRSKVQHLYSLRFDLFCRNLLRLNSSASLKLNHLASTGRYRIDQVAQDLQALEQDDLPYPVDNFCEQVASSYSKFEACYTRGTLDTSFLDYELEQQLRAGQRYPSEVIMNKANKEGVVHLDEGTGLPF